jgi:hypothetical protein
MSPSNALSETSASVDNRPVMPPTPPPVPTSTFWTYYESWSARELDYLENSLGRTEQRAQIIIATVSTLAAAAAVVVTAISNSVQKISARGVTRYLVASSILLAVSLVTGVYIALPRKKVRYPDFDAKFVDDPMTFEILDTVSESEVLLAFARHTVNRVEDLRTMVHRKSYVLFISVVALAASSCLAIYASVSVLT